jgi:hypothetical protein
MSELGELMRMSFLRYIPKAMLLNWTQIDKGSFGKIYKCSYVGTEVAVKEIGQEDSNSVLKTRMRELFLELRVLVLVDHPCVVQFLGTAMDFPKSGSQDPSVDMVFSMCHGGSVHRALFGNEGSPHGGHMPKLSLQPMQKVQIASQVASGLTYLHSKRIIHRCATRPAVAWARACACASNLRARQRASADCSGHRPLLHPPIGADGRDGWHEHSCFPAPEPRAPRCRDLNTRNILLTTQLDAKIADFGCAVSAGVESQNISHPVSLRSRSPPPHSLRPSLSPLLTRPFASAIPLPAHSASTSPSFLLTFPRSFLSLARARGHLGPDGTPARAEASAGKRAAADHHRARQVRCPSSASLPCCAAALRTASRAATAAQPGIHGARAAAGRGAHDGHRRVGAGAGSLGDDDREEAVGQSVRGLRVPVGGGAGRGAGAPARGPGPVPPDLLRPHHAVRERLGAPASARPLARTSLQRTQQKLPALHCGGGRGGFAARQTMLLANEVPPPRQAAIDICPRCGSHKNGRRCS